MPDDHCPAMPQLTAVDGQFGTHTLTLGPCRTPSVPARISISDGLLNRRAHDYD
jgi:hypothetical protein